MGLAGLVTGLGAVAGIGTGIAGAVSRNKQAKAENEAINAQNQALAQQAAAVQKAQADQSVAFEAQQRQAADASKAMGSLIGAQEMYFTQMKATMDAQAKTRAAEAEQRRLDSIAPLEAKKAPIKVDRANIYTSPLGDTSEPVLARRRLVGM